ncbi:MAG: NUDIX hydrolase [Sporichthyaceae bacterium]
MSSDPAILHADAVAVLRSYRSAGPAQAGLRADYLAHLAAHADALDRGCTPAHVTASALVLDAAGSRVLLMLHRKVRRWLQMGGHCEQGDRTLADTALREAREESGLAALSLLPGGPVLLDRHEAPCSPAVDHHLDVMFAAVAPAGALPLSSAESIDLAWFDVDALPADADTAVRALVIAARARLLALAGSGP